MIYFNFLNKHMTHLLLLKGGEGVSKSNHKVSQIQEG